MLHHTHLAILARTKLINH